LTVPEEVHVPSVEERLRVTAGPKDPAKQYQVYEDVKAAGDGLITFAFVGRGGRDSVTISVDDRDRLNTRRSLMEPEKSSPALPAGVTPFQPIRKEEVNEDAEMAYVEFVDEATLDPSMYAVRVLEEDEPE